MKFNVFHWNGREWIYIATAPAPSEIKAAQMIASRFALKGRFASYPHLDTIDEWKQARSQFVEVA